MGITRTERDDTQDLPQNLPTLEDEVVEPAGPQSSSSEGEEEEEDTRSASGSSDAEPPVYIIPIPQFNPAPPTAARSNNNIRQGPLSSPTNQRSGRMGQRKARRVANVLHLLELGGEDDEDNFPDLKISRSLLHLDIPEKALTDCMEFSEAKYEAKLKRKSRKRSNTISSGEDCFKLLTASQRTVLKRNFNNGFLLYIHDELVKFFFDSPDETYYSPRDLTSFERLIVHSVSKFYKLLAKSIMIEENRKIIGVKNPHFAFVLPDTPLLDLLDKMKKKPYGIISSPPLKKCKGRS